MSIRRKQLDSFEYFYKVLADYEIQRPQDHQTLYEGRKSSVQRERTSERTSQRDDAMFRTNRKRTVRGTQK